VVLLLFLIYFDLPVELCGIYAAVFVFLVRMPLRKERLGLNDILSTFEETSRSMLSICVLGAGAGIIIAGAAMSGLGISLSAELVSISGGNLVVLLVLTAVTCIILGLGLSTLTCYIMLIILVGPALIKAGISPLSAHLFIFYYAVFSFITPPVATAAYTTALIAQSSMLRVGFLAMRLALVAYVVPFIFVYQPALLMDGTPLTIFIAFAIAVIGTFLVAVGVEGFLFRKIKLIPRIMLGASGMALLIPYPWLQGAGAVLAAIFLFWEWWGKRKYQK
jgi:TRAP-type uncharacterized transport system fused permease subunit